MEAKVIAPGLEGFDQAKVCVVGGGISGAILALKLARAGIEVVVIERLPTRDSTDSSRGTEASEVETVRQTREDASPGGPAKAEDPGTRSRPDLPFGGAALRPTTGTLRRWQKATGSSQFEPESFARWIDEAVRLLESSSRKLERPSPRHRVQLGIETLGLRAAEGVPLYSPQSSLLSLAEKAGARIYSQSFVRRILLLGTGAVGLEFESVREGANPTVSTLSCSCVVVCAGTMESVEILRRSRLLADGGRTARRPSFQLGIRLTGSFAGLPEDDLRAWSSPLYVQDLEGEGLTLADVPRSPNGRTSNSGVVAMECLLSGRPTWGLLPGAWGWEPALPRLRRGIATVGEILFASGAERVSVDARKPWVFHRVEELDPFLRGRAGVRRPALTARHPAGSIRAGEDSERFPVSTAGELRGYSGIWMTGASVLPDACTGPSDLPVAALSVLTAEALVQRLT